MKNKMRTKNLFVSFLVLAAALFVVSSVSAYTIDKVEIDGVVAYDGTSWNDVSLDAGETVEVEVWYTATQYDEDVYVEVEIDNTVETVRSKGVIFDGDNEKETVMITVPYDLADDLYDEFDIEIKVEGDDDEQSIEGSIEIKRSAYDIAVKSVSTSANINAGESFPVEFVLKNVGFHDLDDVYVKASVEALGIESSGYLGDIVAYECDDDLPQEYQDEGIDRKCDEDDQDSVAGRLYLEVPFGATAGVYTLELTVANDDMTASKVVQVAVHNEFETTVFKSGNSLWIVNPTDKVVGYRIVAESPASASESIVFVPAGASTTVDITPNAEGEYTFDVNVFTLKGELVETVTFSGNTVAATADTADSAETNPIVVLTVVLAIIFIVLLIVLIVLIGKKPEKSGEFGESYY